MVSTVVIILTFVVAVYGHECKDFKLSLVESIDTLNIKTSGNVMEYVCLLSNILKQQDQVLKIFKIGNF
jgi:hypothetical protein